MPSGLVTGTAERIFRDLRPMNLGFTRVDLAFTLLIYRNSFKAVNYLRSFQWTYIPKRKTMMKSLLVLTALLLVTMLAAAPSASAVIQGHAPSPLVIQGHSPIVLLVTDPNGNQIGCKAIPCTSSASSNFVDTIPGSEGPATYNFTTNTITIANPIAGTWTVEYIGTASGEFTITATTCPESNGDILNNGHSETSCTNDPDDKLVTLILVEGTVAPGQINSVGFVLNSDGTITTSSVGVPQFPLGMGVLISSLFVGLVLLRSRRPMRLK